jgi:Mad3/BUB1 homology region 2
VNLEQLYVDSAEFSFEEILAKKRSLHGLRFEVEKPTTPAENVFKAALEKSPREINKSEKPRSHVEHVFEPVTKRSPLQHETIVLAPSPPALQPARLELETNDDGIVYTLIRGAFL